MKGHEQKVPHYAFYTYDATGRLTDLEDAAESEIDGSYVWNDDGTLASYPGRGYRRNLTYEEEGHVTSISRDSTLAYEYGYGFDGDRRWRKDIGGNQWEWFPCGVACCAGELVEMTSDLSGANWSVSATALSGPGGLLSRSSEFHHRSVVGGYDDITSSSAASLRSSIKDSTGVIRHMIGSATSPYYSPMRQGDEGLVWSRGTALQSDTGLSLEPSGANDAESECEHEYDRCMDKAEKGHEFCLTACAMATGGCLVACGLLNVLVGPCIAACIAIGAGCAIGCLIIYNVESNRCEAERDACLAGVREAPVDGGGGVW